MSSLGVVPFSLKSPVTLVCHDAGAANLIFAWLADWSKYGLLHRFEFKLCLRGPAEKIWKLNPVPLPQMQWHTELNNAVTDSQTVLTGTGWASSLEYDARRLASMAKISSIAVIDHWVNYLQRFERDGTLVLPDEIWVSDSYALEKAHQLFTNIPVIELTNTYLNNLIKDIPPVAIDCNNLLYVLEPIRNDWGRNILGEFQCLDFFAKHMGKVLGQKMPHIFLRPHPSDPPGKYAAWIKKNAHLKPKLDGHASLNAAISNARWVVGAETFAMVVALCSGRRTFSTLPPWADKCRLPFSEILHFKDFI